MARPTQDPQIRITEILNAAEFLFANKGYHKTTIHDITQEIGVAQGMLYYYFKSKEEILEALLNRHLSSFLVEIKDMVISQKLTSAEKISAIICITLDSICYKSDVLFNSVLDEQNLYVKDRISRHTNLSLTPWLLKVIEEGIVKQDFTVTHPCTASDFILLVMRFLIETISNKTPADILLLRVRMAEALLEKTLGSQEGTIHITL